MTWNSVHSANDDDDDGSKFYYLSALVPVPGNLNL